MKVSVDIGGVLSAYPHKMLALLHPLHHDGHQIHVITDMPETMRDEVLTQLRENGFEWIDPENVRHADYETHGHLAKALILYRLQIGIHIDDFPGYLVWDSALGRAPLRLLVTPDAFRPFFHPDWKCEGSNFGRSCADIREVKKEISGVPEAGPWEEEKEKVLGLLEAAEWSINNKDDTHVRQLVRQHIADAVAVLKPEENKT